MTEQLFKYTLGLADDAMVHSCRLAEWCSNAPILEEDLALTNFALDLLGRAQMLYAYAAKIEGKGRTEDDLAYRRSERQYFNHLMTELPNGDFAYTIAKILLIAVYENMYYTALQNSSDETLRAIAAKTVKETAYHKTHAADWTVRLGDGTDESHQRMQTAIDQLWKYTGEFFEKNSTELALMDQNIAVNRSDMHEGWKKHIAAVLHEATLKMPADGFMQKGGRNGVHTEYLGHILSEMQYLQRAYPDATW
jgi:ring-1,2-phenylacetyl-CoA epoxidase subunit PaaC